MLTKRKRCTVNGKPLQFRVLLVLGHQSEDRTAAHVRTVATVRALNAAGYKYMEAHGKYGATIVDTKYRGIDVRFSLQESHGGLEGYVMLPASRMRTAGVILVSETKVNVIIDMVEHIPSMTLLL